MTTTDTQPSAGALLLARKLNLHGALPPQDWAESIYNLAQDIDYATSEVREVRQPADSDASHLRAENVRLRKALGGIAVTNAELARIHQTEWERRMAFARAALAEAGKDNP